MNFHHRQIRSGGGVSIFVHQKFEFVNRLDLCLKCDEVDVESVFFFNLVLQ